MRLASLQSTIAGEQSLPTLIGGPEAGLDADLVSGVDDLIDSMRRAILQT